MKIGDNENVQLYPNPMAERSMLTFIAPQSGNAVIGIVDLSGKTVCQTSTLLSTGTHSFRISGISRGMYFVKVTGNSYHYCSKLLSKSNLSSEGRIEYVSSVKSSTGNPLKSTKATIDMPYTDGDQLLFKGISGIYGTIVADVPVSSKTITFNFVTCTDNDGNNYATVQIGAQTWMAENLNVGIRIDGMQTNNSVIEKYCYNNDENTCNTYGGLYQWNEMMQYMTTPGVQGICPSGWHIPTDGEWTTLTTFLGGTSVVGGKMKSTGTIEADTGLWYYPNTGATNESGFTAVPAGDIDGGGIFVYIGYDGCWWSSSEFNPYYAWYRALNYDNSGVGRYYCWRDFEAGGFSVRCVRDL